MNTKKETVQFNLLQTIKSKFWGKLDNLNRPTAQSLKNLLIEPVDVTFIPFIENIMPISTILLAYIKEDEKASPEFKGLPPFETISSNHNDSNEEYTGSPLESPFNLIDLQGASARSNFDSSSSTIVQNPQQPLPVIEASLLRNLYSFELLKMFKQPTCSVLDVLPLVVLCDQSDRQKTALLGMAYFSKCKSLIFEVTTSEGTIKNGLPKLDFFENHHKRLFPQPCSKVDVVSEYNILKGNFSSYMTLECRWNNPSQILSVPTPTALCHVKIQIMPGEERSPLRILYKEISMLRNAVSALKTGEMCWTVNPTEDRRRCIDIVKDMFEVIKEGGVWKPAQNLEDTVGLNELAACLEEIALGKKQNGDFTYNLWLALQGCCSYKELKEALEYVIATVQRDDIHLMVHRGNRTTLGKWIRKLSLEEHNDLKLNDGSAIFSIFAELGIEKLRNDYCDAFFGMELATQDLLEQYISPSISDPEEASLSLLKLHIILEMVITCQSYLNLPKMYLGIFARKALKAFEMIENPFSDESELIFPLPVSTVEPILKRLVPEKWQVTMKSEEENFSLQTIGLFTQHLLFPLPGRAQNSPKNDSEAYYYATMLFSVQDQF